MYFADKGVIYAFGHWKSYEPRHGESMSGVGVRDAFIVEGPWVEVDPSEPIGDLRRGSWRWRYSTPGLDRLLRVRYP